eukprot:68601-Pyramimonas_sp.AAC.1
MLCARGVPTTAGGPHAATPAGCFGGAPVGLCDVWGTAFGHSPLGDDKAVRPTTVQLHPHVRTSDPAGYQLGFAPLRSPTGRCLGPWRWRRQRPRGQQGRRQFERG